MLRSLRNTARLIKISLTLARHDALFVLEAANMPAPVIMLGKLFARKNIEPRKGRRLAAALEELGPTFIKLGQALSTRSDLVGEDIAGDLSDLRDNLPAFPASEVRAIIEREFSANVDVLFSEFDDRPIAAASIAQVHFGVTADGHEVAIKVLRPGIEDAFARDLKLFFWLAEMVERALPSYRRLKPVEVVRVFEESVKFELDLRFEAGAAVEMAKNLKQDDGFVVPTINWSLTSQRVMTMSRIKGIPMGDINALIEAGHDLDAILEKAARSFFNQVFRDGFFHADLHPGNLFILENGDIAAVDFGIMGRIDHKNQIYVAEILHGFLKEDYRHVAQVHFDAGWVPADKSVENFALACMAIGKPIMGKPLSEISVAKLLGQLFKVAETFEMETQLHLLMLQKTMMLAEGVGRMLNPHVNMWKMSEPLIEEWAHKNLGVEARIKSTAEDAFDFARKLPRLLTNAEAAFSLINDGGIKLHPDSVQAMTASRKRLHRQWLTFAWTALAILTLAIVVS